MPFEPELSDTIYKPSNLSPLLDRIRDELARDEEDASNATEPSSADVNTGRHLLLSRRTLPEKPAHLKAKEYSDYLMRLHEKERLFYAVESARWDRDELMGTMP